MEKEIWSWQELFYVSYLVKKWIKFRRDAPISRTGTDEFGKEKASSWVVYSPGPRDHLRDL